METVEEIMKEMESDIHVDIHGDIHGHERWAERIVQLNKTIEDLQSMLFQQACNDF